MAQFFLDAEDLVLSRAEGVRTSTLADVERQRCNVESLIGMFAERLGEQEEGLSAVQEQFGAVLERFERHAEALHRLAQAQAAHEDLLRESLSVMRLLLETLGKPLAGAQASSLALDHT